MAVKPAAEHLFAALQRRGALHCASPGAGPALAAFSRTRLAPGAQPVSAYAGFDPTGPSLHLGHLAVVLGLRRLQDVGVRPIALVSNFPGSLFFLSLVEHIDPTFPGCNLRLSPSCLQIGGATALIGDPTGKTADRPLLSPDLVASNTAGIRKCLDRLLDLSPTSSPGNTTSGLLVNNADFYAGLGVLDFMRTVGTRFRLSAMLNKDTVRSRLEGADVAGGGGGEGMSYCEFSYPLFQGYDFLRLFSDHGCALQLGGADQWGNIAAGIDFVRRATRGGEVHGMTVPLLTTSGGAKLGKSAGNVPVWLDPDLTSHHAFYQYLLGTHDDDAPRLLRLLTLLPDEAVGAIESAHAGAPQAKGAQVALADEVTRLVRGPDAVASARRSAAALFGGRGPWAGTGDGGGGGSGSASEPGGGGGLSAGDILSLVAEGQLPSATLPAGEVLGVGLEVAEAAVRAGAAKSKAEARRMIAARGLYVNGVRVEDPKARLGPAHFQGGTVALLAAGKKKMWALVLDTAAAS